MKGKKSVNPPRSPYPYGARSLPRSHVHAGDHNAAGTAIAQSSNISTGAKRRLEADDVLGSPRCSKRARQPTEKWTLYLNSSDDQPDEVSKTWKARPARSSRCKNSPEQMCHRAGLASDASGEVSGPQIFFLLLNRQEKLLATVLAMPLRIRTPLYI